MDALLFLAVFALYPPILVLLVVVDTDLDTEADALPLFCSAFVVEFA